VIIMNRQKRKTRLVRVDDEIWGACERLMPGETGPTISRVLYNSSLFRAENYLRDLNKELSYGKKKGKKKFKSL